MPHLIQSAHLFWDVQELAERLIGENVLVNSIHPGGVDTELGRHITDVIERALGKDVAAFVHNNVAPRAGRGAWDPADAALTQIYAAVGPSLKQQRITGKYFHPVARLTTPDPHAHNKTLQKFLWQLTEKFIEEHP